jgi:hypothetical protein
MWTKSRLREITVLGDDLPPLKGYGQFSYERFILVTTGRVIPETVGKHREDELFFAFIDERNLLDGLRGGYSSDNIDEFCTSFFHTLLYPERFEENLQRPLRLPSGTGTHLLTSCEKERVTMTYIQNMDLFGHLLGEFESLPFAFANAVKKLPNSSGFSSNGNLSPGQILRADVSSLFAYRKPAYSAVLIVFH